MITANQFNNCSLAEYERRLDCGFGRKGIIAQFRELHLPLPIKVSDSEPLKAYVNHGRWIVKCECGGAEKAWEEGLFMCLSCWNSGHKHQYRRVVFPKERARIEELLIKRPLINRNWSPGETLAQLKKENKEHKGELL